MSNYSPRTITTFSTPFPPDHMRRKCLLLRKQMIAAANNILPANTPLECTDAVVAIQMGRPVRQRWVLHYKARRLSSSADRPRLPLEEVKQHCNHLEDLVRRVLQSCGPLGGPVEAYFVAFREWRVMFSPPKQLCRE